MQIMLTVTDIKHYAYCPVIIYINRFLGINEEETEYMKLGQEVEMESMLAPAIRMVRAVKLMRSVSVKSRAGFNGIVDFVLITKHGEYVPLDVKWSNVAGRARPDHVLQLAAYALAIEESFDTVVKLGLLYYITGSEGKFIKIYITSSLKAQVVNALNRIKKIASGELGEVRINKRKCNGCNYRQHCPVNPW
ncbi:CRISPR-associated protein Cas4 [Thermocladium modestius]|uniref:CRISPR-associated exonuclease Cas4 n=1 Tax=Thermocladium modestius TaxID=62609 RepID=A0A830GWR9_9CREN|nr:CRISPR-associated protein Cas4 [Thermocladium modestius]GGP20802.1 CRISPR-associated protein Cas4 [Thermocladium modestius]